MPYTTVGKGFLMKVDQKRSERSPDYTGKLELDDGQEIQVSGWVEESKSGKRYLSLSLQVHDDTAAPKGPRSEGDRRRQPDAVPASQPPLLRTVPARDNWDDDVPF